MEYISSPVNKMVQYTALAEVTTKPLLRLLTYKPMAWPWSTSMSLWSPWCWRACRSSHCTGALHGTQFKWHTIQSFIWNIKAWHNFPMAIIHFRSVNRKVPAIPFTTSTDAFPWERVSSQHLLQFEIFKEGSPKFSSLLILPDKYRCIIISFML